MTKIYYFSATGNSLWSAKKIAAMIEASGGDAALHDIGKEVEKSEIIAEAEAVVIVFPSYALGLPIAVRRFAQKAVFKTPYLAAFATYGSTLGWPLGDLRRILKTKGVGKSYFGRIQAVQNYLAIFAPPDGQKIARMTALQKEETEEAARAVIERRVNSVRAFHPFYFLVSAFFTRKAGAACKFYKIGGACDGCGTCEKICPVSAVSVKEGRPVFKAEKCEHCLGCVNLCPRRAIQFGRVKSGSPGYRHPEVGIADLIRRQGADS